MKKTLIILLLISTSAFAQQDRSTWSEDDWNRAWCTAIGGVPEHRLDSNQRVDCLDERRGIAWEMDFAKSPKYLECLGQALSYSRQTGHYPGCVLIIKLRAQCLYVERLWEDILHLGLPFRIATTGVSCDPLSE